MTKALREAWAEAVIDVAGTDDRVIVLDADLAPSTRADLFADAYPDRFFEIGIDEQNMVGMAAGLTTLGYRPWLSTFGVFFTQRALDVVRVLVSQTKMPVKFGGAYSGIINGYCGKTHQDIEDIAILRAMPNMTLIAPADAAETAAAVRWATDYDGPVYLRLAREAEIDLFDADYTFQIGQPRILREGDDVVLISTGIQTARVVQAADLLAEQGIAAKVIHVATIKPLDSDRLLEMIGRDTPLVITVEEHSVLGGLGGLVAEIVADQAPGIRVVRVGLADGWSESAPTPFLLDKYGLSPKRVAEQVGAVLAASEPVRDHALQS